jgi:hypothetical protein
LEIEDREVLRIFRVEAKKITLFSFFDDNQLIESVYEIIDRGFIFKSEDSDEIAVISQEG